MTLIFSQLWYYYWMSTRALLLHFETLGALGVCATTLIAIFGYVDAGLAGVCITSAVSFNVSIYWASRFWTSLELDLKYVITSFIRQPYLTVVVAPWRESSNTQSCRKRLRPS